MTRNRLTTQKEFCPSNALYTKVLYNPLLLFNILQVPKYFLNEHTPWGSFPKSSVCPTSCSAVVSGALGYSKLPEVSNVFRDIMQDCLH